MTTQTQVRVSHRICRRLHTTALTLPFVAHSVPWWHQTTIYPRTWAACTDNKTVIIFLIKKIAKFYPKVYIKNYLEKPKFYFNPQPRRRPQH